MKRCALLLLSVLLICTMLSGCLTNKSEDKATDLSQETSFDYNNTIDNSDVGSYEELPEETESEQSLPAAAPAITRLEDVYLIDSNHYNLKTGGFTDSFGNSSYDSVHYYMGLNQSHWLDDEPWSLHYLNKQYKTFSGTIVLPGKDEIEASFYVHIYTDRNMLYSVNDVTKKGGKVDFIIDVTGCEQLEIRTGETSRAGYSDGFDLGIADTVLLP